MMACIAAYWSDRQTLLPRCLLIGAAAMLALLLVGCMCRMCKTTHGCRGDEEDQGGEVEDEPSV